MACSWARRAVASSAARAAQGGPVGVGGGGPAVVVGGKSAGALGRRGPWLIRWCSGPGGSSGAVEQGLAHQGVGEAEAVEHVLVLDHEPPGDGVLQRGDHVVEAFWSAASASTAASNGSITTAGTGSSLFQALGEAGQAPVETFAMPLGRPMPDARPPSGRRAARAHRTRRGGRDPRRQWAASTSAALSRRAPRP